ncbi:beta-lactamase-like protein [Dichotomocladium elegans]|nr:beta-lactamase-like protein [Dichotomocladium elegans]
MTEALVSLPKFARLSDRVWRVLGLNPGKFTLQGTNTYLLGAGPQKMLIDSGEGIPEYIPLLKESLKSISSDAFISDIIVTHAHPDHYGGLKDILGSTLNDGSKGPIQVHKHNGAIAHRYANDFPHDIKIRPLKDSQIFQLDSVTLRVIHTPGHTKDHCAFWLEEEKSLFTADCILGQGTAVFEDLSEYLQGLRRLLNLKPKRLYPGHGPVIEDGVAKINEYIEHRLLRERQVIDVLKSDIGKEWTAKDIAGKIYKGLADTLFIAATRGIVLHLLKLEKDGRLRMQDDISGVTDPGALMDKEWVWIG